MGCGCSSVVEQPTARKISRLKKAYRSGTYTSPLVGRAPPYTSMSGHRRLGHVMTRIGAALARVSAKVHLLAVGESVAGRFALLADLGADGAGVMMQIGCAEHEIGAGLAHFGAIHQQPDVMGVAHFAALRETMCDGDHANALAVAAVLNALLHVKGFGVGKNHRTSMAIW